jgi:hypothetical protein
MTQRISIPVELGDLLANTLGAVVQAQERLDAYTLARKEAFEAAPSGSLALPPLWYLFNNVTVEMELSASVGSVSRQGKSAASAPHLLCSTLNPTAVSLYGYQAAAGLRVRVQMAPQGAVPIKCTSHPEEDTQPGNQQPG